MGTTIYPFDPTGLASTNLISNEQHIALLNLNEFLVIVNYAPFFGNSLIVTYSDVNTPLKTLVVGVDYSLALPYWAASRSIGMSIFGGIVLLNTNLTGTVAMQYQTIGGQWCGDNNYIYTMIAEEKYDPRFVLWDVLTNVQEVFPNINNSLTINTIYGVNTLVDSLNNLAVAIAVNPTAVVFQ